MSYQYMLYEKKTPAKFVIAIMPTMTFTKVGPLWMDVEKPQLIINVSIIRQVVEINSLATRT